jgi:hypothetical protein
MSANKAHKREQIERLRGWIIYLLYKARPRHVEFDSLQRLLDKFNLPVTRLRLAEEIDYLRSLRLVKVSLGHSQPELEEGQQTRHIQRYADADREDVSLACASLTAAGINFQEELDQMTTGIARVD